MTETRFIPADSAWQPRDGTAPSTGTYEPLPPRYHASTRGRDRAMYDRIMSLLENPSSLADNGLSAMAGGPKHVPASTGKAAAAPAAGKPATAGSKPAPAEVLQATLAPRIARLFKGITYKT